MYYPYLRARQFELLSLRELVTEGQILENVIPVLEPVKDGFSSLTLAHNIFKECNFHPYLILNPIVGELKGDYLEILNYLVELEDCAFKPAFHYSNNLEFVLSTIINYDLKDCMIICLTNFTDDIGFRTLCEHPSVTHIMLQDPNNYRSLDRFIKQLNKTYIRLNDVFQKQAKNSLFLEIGAHKFTEEHLYYREERYQGFSDYTVVPSEFIDGGSTPRAVVIHLTYLYAEENNEIWIRHFTSKTNDSIANVQGKFAEAAYKAISFCNEHQLKNSALDELITYYNEKRYPGLGIVKKISIKNHLLVVSDYLSGGIHA
ncbi:hypothetical protein EV200_1015 [Pedobacter psychrotolerans]|uniref:Sce7725 family protein n=1 Tax=Pedobacter psychrotolerans TaxID=1843235 RepID=A0A4R2HLK2_9SPHI|nr:sce7725 family protein [Pedobacter psychrotolerans]TCO30575.1 hypothetical protein EV200_1015 [Pedobacter psychrotolerans]GGE69148.1 hypothetical protein GCM10011413_39780 [Pedobacter psychrotolerans]